MMRLRTDISTETNDEDDPIILHTIQVDERVIRRLREEIVRKIEYNGMPLSDIRDALEAIDFCNECCKAGRIAYAKRTEQEGK